MDIVVLSTIIKFNMGYNNMGLEQNTKIEVL